MITPPVVRPTGPSLDNGVANSGILQALPGKTYLVTPLYYERYRDLCKRWGTKLVPPMTEPRWITPSGTNYVITSDGIMAFGEMDFYDRNHKTP